MLKHIPVMAKEVIKALDLKANGIYVDLTVGLGGHAQQILQKIPKGLLIGFDKDQFAIDQSNKILQSVSANFKLIHSDFKHFKHELKKLQIDKVDGILVDLGVSSPQLDCPERGFSYNKEAKLDMRMDQSQQLDANHVVNNWDVENLATILKKYADVKLHYRVANAIIKNRPITSTLQLANIVRSSLPARVVRDKNVARQVFQAIRIAVNDEINSLITMLQDAISLLKKNGKLAIITFHSIEDQIVKKEFARLTINKTGKLPIIEEKQFLFKTFKVSLQEALENRRARSSRLRVLTKVQE